MWRPAAAFRSLERRALAAQRRPTVPRHPSFVSPWGTSGSTRDTCYSRTSRLTATKAQTDPPLTSLSLQSPPTPLATFNLATISLLDLTDLIVTQWKYPKFRVDQVWHWIRNKGVLDVHKMTNVPATLVQQLQECTQPSALTLVAEQVSIDGTIKRAYQIVDTVKPKRPVLLESVLMGPYRDGHYTACISSQAGCAQGCVFCATGQQGLVRQLTADEIYDQVVQFATLLQRQSKSDTREFAKPQRLSNIVFMGMGEPLANYKAVRAAVNRITTELGISARRITVSTVGLVPMIRQLTHDPHFPPVRLAVSLHCATDVERSALLPANARNGGLPALMESLHEYITTTGRRLTLEWALIAGENDSIETARTLGRLIQQYQLRPDMVHINVIPLNPTSAYTGAASRAPAVNAFCRILHDEFQVSCTPRVRRGIDIDAGCGQLTTALLLQNDTLTMQLANVPEAQSETGTRNTVVASVVPFESSAVVTVDEPPWVVPSVTDASVTPISLNTPPDQYDFDDDFDNPEWTSRTEQQEANRLIALVQGTTIALRDLPDVSS